MMTIDEPMQPNHQTDLEAGSSHLDPFDIANTKNASFHALKRWREAALVLNASRRFRYTLDLKNAQEKQQRTSMIRAHAQVIRAALLFKLAGQRAIVLGTEVAPLPPCGEYGISLEQLASVTRDQNLSALQQYGGRFLWEAWQDLTLIILIVAAVLSLALGIHTKGLKEGWYDGGSITFAVLLVIFVTGVGINTEWGLLMASIAEDTGEETPLQVRLNGVATFIGIVGLAVALFVLIVLLCRFFTGNSKNPDGTTQFVHGQASVSKTMDGVVHIITAAVTIVVVAVPEGLPLAVTLTLSACETMGSATTICSDKTGTLTLNQMTVVEAYIGEKKLDSPEDGSQLHSAVSSLLNEGITQNTSGSVFTSKDGKGIEVSGSPTEKAILSWGVKIGMKFDVVRSQSIILHVSPFNSTKKRGGVAVREQSGSQVHMHWKGAAEIILASCTGYLDSNGCLQSIEREKDFLKEAIEDMAAKSLRCVAIAYQTCSVDEVPTDEEQLAQWVLPEDGLILLAILGIKDPCRPGVKDAVRKCSDSGVKVRMVTGDNIQTARAIALECGILTSNTEVTEFEVIEGKTFRELSEKEREQVAKRMSVMGRSSPNDKLLLVQTLRKLGEVVAVTGDGTNDAPALHEADIGLSMGILGTEVAKESSDIIILDDNFASVVKVVRWGRSVYANIQKFIQFQLTVNVAALVINVVAAVSSGDVPLNTVQLLWVNLIMDTLGALALATEPPTDHLMHRPPVGRREPLVTNIMWRNLLIQALYQSGILLVLNFQGKSILSLEHDDPKHANMVKNTLIFNAFVFCQIFNEVNARKPDEINVFTGVTKNPLFTGVVGTTLILQIIIIEFLGKFTSTVRLSWKLWMVSLVIGIISWPLAAAGKLIPVPKTPLAKVFIKLYQRCIAARNA